MELFASPEKLFYHVELERICLHCFWNIYVCRMVVLMIDIFNKRWHGIQGQTVGEGKYQMHVIRVQTADQGPWQALNEAELAKLLVEHNQNIYMRDRDRGVVNTPAHPKEKQSFSKPKKKAKAKK